MTKNTIPPEILSHFKMWREIESETHRGATILAHAYLDSYLRKALESLFAKKGRTASELFETGALSSFETKIRLLYCLGFYGKRVFQDLQSINLVRNKFAHRHKTKSFDDNDIKELCLAFNHEYFVGERPAPCGPRERYLGAVSMITNIIRHEMVRGDRVYTSPKPTFPD